MEMQAAPWERYGGAAPPTMGAPQEPAVPRVIVPRQATPQTPEQAASSSASAASSAASANRIQAMTQPEVQGQQLQNQTRQRELQVPAGMSDATVGQARDRVIAARQLRQQLQRTNDLFRPYEGTTSLGELIWSPGVQNFQDQAQSMMPLVRRLFRSPDASTTEQENAYYEALLPNWHATDVNNRRRIDQLNQMLDALEEEYGRVLPEGERRPVQSSTQSELPSPVDPNRVQPGESMGQVGNLPIVPMDTPNGQNQLDNEGGTYLTDEDRRLAGVVTALANSRLSADQTIAQINNLLRTHGRFPLDSAGEQSIRNARQNRSRHPGFAPTPSGHSDPNLVTGVANTDYGAGVISAGDALLAGNLDSLTSDPERTRAGMELLRENHPISSVIGEAAGSLLPGAAAERAVGYGARLLNRVRGIETLSRGSGELRTIGEMVRRPLGNAAYGGAYGAGSSDDDRMGGAFRGALLSAAGGEAGDRATAGVGRALTGARNEASRYLTERGIPLTIGQIGANGGVVGRTLSRVESALESVPLLGNAIRARRADSFRAMNEAAFSDALSSIGGPTTREVGEQGVEAARGAVGRAYNDALRDVRVRADDDPAFVNEMRAAMDLGSRLPDDLRAHFDNFVENRLAHELVDGELTGEGYQALRQELREDRMAVKGQLGARRYVTAVRRLEGALERLVQRGAPDAVPALQAADRAYRRTRVVEGAVGRSINNQGEGGVFTPAQLGLEARTNARRFGGDEATTNRPFYELQRNSQNVLPSNVPNSGTADRAWVLQAFPAIVAGGAYQTGLVDKNTAALFAGLGLPYTRRGQQMLQKLLVNRPDRVRQIGEAILRQRGLGARAGAGAVNPITDQTRSPLP